MNVDTVRAGYEAFNRRDFDAVFEFYDPEIVWEQDENFVEPGTHYGHAGVRRAFDSLFESFESFQIEVHELFDLDDRVLALSRVMGHGRGSGLQVDNHGAELWSLRNRRAVKVRLFLDRAEAFEAAGFTRAPT